MRARLGEAPRDKLAHDPHRPLYHFLPAENWMNDPNGLIQWDGTYHLFYQQNPNGPFHGTIHWGHAKSDDLVFWKDLPTALAPTPGGPDEDGCFSGCAVDHEGVPTLVYTGVRGDEQRPCLATSPDGLVSWHKHPSNPVIPSPPKDLDIVGFRDHSVWREDGAWYQLIGSGIRGVGGAVLLYGSQDLVDWEYLGPLLVGDKYETEPFWTGSMWECPDFLPLGGKHALILSAYHEGNTFHTFCLVGTYEGGRFVPETGKVLDRGGHFYAPQTMVDDRGRRVMMGWLKEGRSDREQRRAGWSGVMSLPRVLRLLPDGTPAIEPLPELEVLRSEHRGFADLDLAPGDPGPLGDVRGDCLEIALEVQPKDASHVGLKVRRSPNGEEETVILYDVEKDRLVVDASRSSVNPEVEKDAPAGPVGLEAGEALELRAFIDRSVVEVYANGRTCLTDRIYPTRDDSLGIELFTRGGVARLKRLDVWKMRPIWAAG